MSTDVIAQIKSQSSADLIPIIHQILDDDATPIGELSASKVGRSAGTATAGIFRVTGRAQTDTGEQTWSAVVKALGVPEVERAWDHVDGMRELEVYRAGAFANTNGGVRTPYCYGIQSRQEIELIWLEDLSDAPQPPWTSDYFVESARHLGRFNAHWPEDALPDWLWLNRQGFRASTTGRPRQRQAFERLPQRRGDPLIQSFAPDDSVDTLLRLQMQCDELAQMAERLPKGVCHLDCHPKNLFPMREQNGSSYTIGIDWSEVGISSLGIDLGHLLGSPMSWLEAPLETARSLSDVLFDAYVAGLRDVGWSGNADEVRLTFLTRLACEALRNTNLVSNALESEEWYGLLEEFLGHSMTDILARWHENREFYRDCAEEASLLAERLA